MKTTRREFIKASAMAGAGFAMFNFGARRALAFSQSPNLALWQTSLRGVGPGGIPVALPDGSIAPVTGVTHYTMDINPFTDTLHPTLGPTNLWGFQPTVGLGGFTGPAHLGGIIVAERNSPIQITFRNNLPPTHLIPIDTTVPGDWTATPAKNRIAVHMHGGHVPWISDGGPFDWWTPTGLHGLSFLNNQVLRLGHGNSAKPNEAEYYYPIDQSARLMWYHDHAFGMDRNTAYAGVASGLVIRDTAGLEGDLRNSGLPDFIENGGRELPLVFQDKIFCGPNITAVDPTWIRPANQTLPGDLWYAHVYDIARYGNLGPNPLGPPPDPSCVPEYFGDTMLTNGTVYPQVTVEARRYRLRILNACNSRFMNLQLYVDDGSPNGITLNGSGNPRNAPALNHAAGDSPNFLVIGTEGGFLPAPAYVPTNGPFGGATIGSLFLSPAERSDVIFDFSKHAGQKLILYSDAPAPFPGGDPRNDYFPGLKNKNTVNALTPAGFGPNTRVMLRFKVVPASSQDPPLGITRNSNLTAGNDPLLAGVGTATIPTGYAAPRQLTLNEDFDGYGRLIQRIGTNQAQPGGGFGQGYIETPPTEIVGNGTAEVWQIANLTGDTHPIHFHLVNVQIISRQPFNTKRYTGIPSYTGSPVPPALFEAGWKETVRMNPGEVTTVIMPFILPTIQNVGQPPSSPRTGGNEFVWHCHILEHEEHDMMRPLVVI
ncbi:MAG: multicopper oxidase domain-containing protein [Acidobacteriia bacterium]|nr:multicopper oxidase domain-containing protein [Terriglobia bacterium]